MANFRAPLITPFCFPTWSFSQLLRYQNTHLAMLNSVFGALYLKKIPALVFQKELIEVPNSLKIINSTTLSSCNSMPTLCVVFSNPFQFAIGENTKQRFVLDNMTKQE
jgi:hypothetical protein